MCFYPLLEKGKGNIHTFFERFGWGEIMRRFWKRIKMVFTIKKFGPFLVDFFKSKSVPLNKKLLSVGLFAAYLIFPFDAIPDFLAFFGLMDDVGVLLLILQQIIKLAPDSLKEKHRLGME